MIKNGGNIANQEYNATQFTRLRPVLLRRTPEMVIAIDMPKKAIKAISDESFISIRTFANKQLSSGDVSFTLPENEQFTTLDGENYILAIETGSNTHTGYGWNLVQFLILKMSLRNRTLLSL